MYIAVAGNIGSGKTTLTEMLSEYFGWKPFFEIADNPYIGDFYEDMERWAFNLQVHFMTMRLKQISQIMASEENVVLDRTIYEDAHIFAKNLHEMELMYTRDFELYNEMFEYASQWIKQPDILIYLRANTPTLISQIKKRGRAYEMSISPEYLERLNEKYEQWIAGYDGKMIIIDVDNNDFVNEPDKFKMILDRIEKLK